MAKEIHQSIVIDAKIKTTLENMDKSVKDLQDGLNKGITSLDMSKGLGNSLSKTLSTFQDEFKHFSDLTKSGKLEFMDSKEAIRSGEKIIEKYREIQRVVGNLSDLQISDAKKLFPDAFKSDVDDLSNKLNSLKQNLGNLEVKGLEVTQAETKLTALNTQINELKGKLIDEKPLEVSVEDANKKLKTAQEEVEKIRNALKEELRLKLDAADSKVTSVKGQIEGIEKARAARDTSKLAVGERGQITYEGKTSAQWKQSGASKEQITAAQTAIQTYAAEERQLTSLRNALKDVTGDANRLREAFTGFGEKTDLTKTAAMLGQSAGQIEQTKNALDNQAQAAENAAQAQDKLNQAQNENKVTNKNIAQTTKDITEQEQKVAKLQAQYTQLFGKIDVSKLEQGLQKTLGKDFTPQMLQNKDGIEQLLTKLRETDQTDFEKLKASLIQLGTNADTAEDYIRQLREGLVGIREDASGIQKAAQEMDMLKNRVLYFFSMTNSVQLFRRAVTKALNTVKELDKTMTEAAVVTEFDVGDMWDKLPQYAKHAQELGVSINGMYQATTLYYQQGLKTNEAMALGIETMKMGKIASMDSTEATKAMTAALRGFNMELNETSATRVNDVYSQLAAVTAADTNQIATAMEKTASIAAAANMEFESTAAFLAQIIETTQEAPETAGTALKTIIARFSEVKSLREQGLASGKDSEGEGIDVNKIQTALKTVGISMEGFFAGTEGLDSILLKLAEKWGTLDFETQRYIATMAAGSRQQSRFIAMMSDYKRTAELVSEAQNSAGASTRQFEKTLESMESKLQRLENAWNEFLMGLANNEILKGAVDLVTSLVTGINNLTNGLSGGNGLLKSFVSLMVTLGGLSMGKAALSGGLGWVGRQMGIKGAEPQNEKTSFADRKAQWNSQRGGRKVLGFMSSKEATERAQDRAHNFGTNKAIKENKKILKNSSNAEDFSQKLQNSTTDTEKNNAAMAAANKTYEETFNKQKDVKVAVAEATKEFERQGGTLVNANQEQEILSNSTKKLGVDYKALGGAVMGAGAAFGGLAVLLSAVGLDEAAEEVGKISGILMGLGAIISFLGPAVQGLAAKIAAAGVTAGAAWAWAIGIVVVIAAIVAIVIALGASAKSAAEEMAELDSQTKALADAADKAEESMQNLADTQKDLANLKNTMDGLIKGTDEWNKALIESNNKVLELLDTYPELAEHIIEEDGLLKVKSEGWNLIAKKQMEAYTNASAARWALSAKKTEIAGRMIDEDEDMTPEEKNARNKALEIQGDIQVEEFYRQVVAANPNLKGNEFSEYSATALAAEGLDNFIKALDEAAASVRINEQAYQEYADMMGITLEEAKEADEETIKNTLAASRVQKQSANQIKIMNQKIAEQSPKQQELIKALLSQDGSKITKDQADRFQSEDDVRKFGETIGMTEEQIKGLWSTIQGVRDSFGILENQIKNLKKEGILSGLLPNANFQIYSGVVSKIAELQASGADPTQINEWFNQLLAGKTEEQQTAILEALAVTDWNSIEDLNNTFSTFAKDGLIDPAIADELNSEMKELAGAVSDNTVAQNQQKGFQLKGIMDQILSGELTNIMSTDQKDALVDSGAFTEDEFQNVGTDEWVFNGDMYSRVVNLYGKINDKTEGQTEDAVGEYNKGENFTQTVKALDSQKFITYYDENSKFSNFEQANAFGIGQMGKEWAGYVGFQTSQDKNANLGYEDWKEKNQSQFEGLTEDQLKEKYLGYMNSLLGANYFSGYAMFSIDDAIGEMKGGMTPTRASLNNIGGSLAKALGVDWQKLTEGKTDEEIKQLILDWYDKYYDNPELKAAAQQSIIDQAKGVGSTAETTAAYGYADTTGFDDDQKKQYQENYEKGIDTRYTYYGGAAFMDRVSDTREKDTEGMSAEEIKKYDTMLKALASDLGQVSKKTKAFAANMSNLSENLNKSKRGTVEYGQALESAYANIGALFGKDAEWAKGLNLSEEILEGLAKGDTGAFKELQKIIQQNIEQGIKDGSDAGLKAFQGMDLNLLGNLEIGTYLDAGSLNGVTDEVLKHINAAGKESQEAFAWMMSARGLTVSYTYGENGQVSGFQLEQSGQANLFSQYSSGSGGGGGSKYENKYDKLHNELEEINDLLRERERLERRYQNLVNRGVDSYKDIAKANQDRVDNLQEENEKQKYIQEQRGKQIEENIAKNPKMEKYIYFETNENGERSIRINWEEINKVKDSKLGEEIDKFYEQNKEWIESYNDAADAIVEGEEAIYDAMQEGKDEYLDFENQVKEAIEKQRQDEIDKLSEVNDSINDTNSKIIESMQEQISAARQERDNAKTEQEIEDKQRRLAYLQQDTSGANALEIMQLQKEIDEQTEDYTDTLIDQKISELQKQNDQAAEQRQRQIDIAQSQLDYYIKTGAVWEDVQKFIADGVNPDGTIKPDSKLMELLKNSAEYKGLSEIGQMDWLKGLETTVAQGLAWREGGGVMSTFWSGKQIEFTTADNQILSGIVQEDGTVKVGDQIYEGVSWEGGNVFKTDENRKIDEEKPQEEPSREPEYKMVEYEYTVWKLHGKEYPSKAAVQKYIDLHIKDMENDPNPPMPKEDWLFYLDSYRTSLENQIQTETRIGKKKVPAYKTGGLADFTGPAWLDGTKSKPEYILNADQTKAFFTLVDVLSGLQSNTSKSTEKTGDNTYDIDINVESIGSDYDVEQLAETVKRLINEDARYRNNNAINLMR